MANKAAVADQSRTIAERMEAVRAKLSQFEFGLVEQYARDRIAPAVYAQGLKDGAEKLRAEMRRERERRRESRGRKVWITFVYFIRSPQAIKIGMSKNPARRLAVIQTGHPERLVLAAQCEGGRELEQTYHRRFAEHRISHEWFAPHPDILAEIARLRALAA